ncbi:hypothetical protein BAE36_08590 [Rhizobium leguminosarum bv. trifolii]|nr:hypothetical protein BAE36_08590 [Rhizobium leguminosarum bv. trifolii]
MILWPKRHAALPNLWKGLCLTLPLSRLGVAFHQRAAADQVAVALDIVYAVDRRPVFVDAEGVGREAGLFAAMGAIPIADEVLPACARRSSMSMLPFLRSSI